MLVYTWPGLYSKILDFLVPALWLAFLNVEIQSFAWKDAETCFAVKSMIKDAVNIARPLSLYHKSHSDDIAG